MLTTKQKYELARIFSMCTFAFHPILSNKWHMSFYVYFLRGTRDGYQKVREMYGYLPKKDVFEKMNIFFKSFLYEYKNNKNRLIEYMEKSGSPHIYSENDLLELEKIMKLI